MGGGSIATKHSKHITLEREKMSREPPESKGESLKALYSRTRRDVLLTTRGH